MSKYRIAWMTGDGVGANVMNATRIVLDALDFDAEYIAADIGWECWRNEGNALPERSVEKIRDTDCALIGPLTSKPPADADAELDIHLRGKGLVYTDPSLKLRQLFRLHTNVRPCKALAGNPLNFQDNIDLVVFRDNTDGMYGGHDWIHLPEAVYESLCEQAEIVELEDQALDRVALSTRILSRQGCENIVRQAFEFARKHKRRNVTIVEKTNTAGTTDGLMTRVARDIAKAFPDIPLWEANVDLICARLLEHPRNYDVLVTENIYGDIVSDLCAGLVGGRDFSSAADIGDSYAVFSPAHGSAPRQVGQHVVSPMAMILAARQMLSWLGELEMADRIERAIINVIQPKNGDSTDSIEHLRQNSTTDVANAVARAL